MRQGCTPSQDARDGALEHRSDAKDKLGSPPCRSELATAAVSYVNNTRDHVLAFSLMFSRFGVSDQFDFILTIVIL